MILSTFMSSLDYPKTSMFKQTSSLENDPSNNSETISNSETTLKEGGEFSFHPLTPTIINDDSSKAYTKALKYAIENKDIKNIALTGSYGSGKSSVLKTFFAKNQQLKYLKISLASFNQEDFGFEEEQREVKEENRKADKPEEGFTSDENLERLLELSILQQIFYHVSHDKIPDSRFKRIKSLGQEEMLDFSLLFIIWFISIWYLFFPNMISLAFSNRLDTDIIKLLAIFVFLTGLGKFVIHIKRIYNNSKLNRLNIQSGEIEIDKGVDHSILNKHIDEIIYFFEVNSYNIVVIEDLDRFDNPMIFSKLREINLLINSSEQVDKHIVFIYAIRDNLFGDSSRTKFFDFIIPVIPVVNHSNSNGFLKKYFKEIKKGEKPGEDYIEKISSFISDMRLLNNIFNEYLIYRNNISESLSQSSKQQEILFSLIVCKNFFPREFMRLTKGRGELHDILNRRKAYLNIISEDLKKEMLQVSREIDAFQAERVKSVNELKFIYIQRLQEKLSNPLGVFNDNSFLDFPSLQKLKLEEFEKFINSSRIKYRQVTGNPLHYHANIQDAYFEGGLKALEVEGELTFQERLNIVKNKENLESKLAKLERLEKELLDIETWDISKIISKISDTSIFGSYSKNPLVIFLIKEGYLKEEYAGYISYFYEGEFTEGDNKFYQSILAGLQQPWTFKLINVENIINKTHIKYFKEKHILNFHLVQYLLVNRFKFPLKAKLLIETLSDGSENSKIFFKEYIDQGSAVVPYVKVLSGQWKGLWNFVSKDDQITVEKKREYFSLILQHASQEDLRFFAVNSTLVQDLTIEQHFFNSNYKVSDSKWKEIFDDLKLKMRSLDLPQQKQEALFEFIFNNRYFVYNLHNFHLFFTKFCNEKITFEEFMAKPLDTVLDSKCEPLIQIFSENKNSLVESLYLNASVQGSKMSQMLFTDLLESSQITEENKDRLIKEVNGQASLKDISNENLWHSLLKERKIVPTWENVQRYFKKTGSEISEDLLGYLNEISNVDKLISDPFNSTEETEALETKIFECNDLEIEPYKKLTHQLFDRPWKILDIKDLSKEKLMWLIDQKYLSFTEEIFNSLKLNKENLSLHFIEKEQKGFREVLEDISLNETLSSEIFASRKIRKHIKCEMLILKKDFLTSIKNDKLKSLISAFLLLNPAIKELELDDMKKFIQWTVNLQDKIDLTLKYQHLLNSESLRDILTVFPYKVKRVLSGAKHLKLQKSKASIEFGRLLEGHNIAGLKISSEENELRIIGKRKR